MPRYRIEFRREWITGRWGFTDRVFTELGGRVADPVRLENAWVVEYKGRPFPLGRLLTQLLNIQREDFERFGTIFDITEVPRQAEDSQPTGPHVVPDEHSVDQVD